MPHNPRLPSGPRPSSSVLSVDPHWDSLLPNRSVLTPAEVAPVLRVSDREIRRLAEAWHETQGKTGLPGFKVGNQWRFARHAIVAHLSAFIPA